MEKPLGMETCSLSFLEGKPKTFAEKQTLPLVGQLKMMKAWKTWALAVVTSPLSLLGELSSKPS